MFIYAKMLADNSDNINDLPTPVKDLLQKEHVLKGVIGHHSKLNHRMSEIDKSQMQKFAQIAIKMYSMLFNPPHLRFQYSI